MLMIELNLSAAAAPVVARREGARAVLLLSYLTCLSSKAEEHADQQEHRGEGSGQGQQEVEPEPDVLLPEGEGDAERKVGEAGHEGRGLALGILRS